MQGTLDPKKVVIYLISACQTLLNSTVTLHVNFIRARMPFHVGFPLNAMYWIREFTVNSRVFLERSRCLANMC